MCYCAVQALSDVSALTFMLSSLHPSRFFPFFFFLIIIIIIIIALHVNKMSCQYFLLLLLLHIVVIIIILLLYCKWIHRCFDFSRLFCFPPFDPDDCSSSSFVQCTTVITQAPPPSAVTMTPRAPCHFQHVCVCSFCLIITHPEPHTHTQHC